MSEHLTADLLKDFLEAFNRHDLDAIMGYFADGCVFYMPRGAGSPLYGSSCCSH